LGLVGGFISGALGLGGGTIFNPILLKMGMPPEVSSATSMYLVFYSTASSSFVYFIYGILDIYYAFWLGFWAIIGTIAGLYFLSTKMKQYKRASPLIILLSVVLGISAVLVPLFAGLEIAESKKNGGNSNLLVFTSYC
jgi:uncharacterized membrane protein YfcA